MRCMFFFYRLVMMFLMTDHCTIQNVNNHSINSFIYVCLISCSYMSQSDISESLNQLNELMRQTQPASTDEGQDQTQSGEVNTGEQLTKVFTTLATKW